MSLVIPAQQKKELRLEGVSFPVLVEARQKGILLKNLQQNRSIKPILDQARQGGFSHADHPFDGDVFACHDDLSPSAPAGQ
jgi:hypothetical protein